MDGRTSDHMGGVLPHGDSRRQRSGLAQAGEILLLVGWIVRAFTLLFFVIYLVAMSAVLATVFDVAADGQRPDDVAGVGGLVLAVFLLIAVLLGVSVGVGIVSWRRARAGQYRTSGILGIVASMLPPVDIILLLGGIFLLVCDEAKAEQTAATEAATTAADTAWRAPP